MKAALTRALLFVAGLALIGWGLLPAAAGPALAAPLLVVTETPTGEPPTPTTPPPPTPTPTEIGAFTPVPTDTPVPPPTDTPPPPPDDDDDPDPTATPTAVPASPTPAPPADIPADPAIGKTVSPGSASVGDSVEYTITVTNLGGIPATGVEVNDTLPAFVSPTGVTASRGEASLDGQTVRVVIGDMEPGETVTIVVQATVVAPAPEGNNRNLAVVTSTSPDGNPDNNQASVPLDTLGPVTLPSTGDAGRGLLPAAALLLGLALVAASLAVRRRAA